MTTAGDNPNIAIKTLSFRWPHRGSTNVASAACLGFFTRPRNGRGRTGLSDHSVLTWSRACTKEHPVHCDGNAAGGRRSGIRKVVCSTLVRGDKTTRTRLFQSQHAGPTL
ncbi:hypothetical protein GGP41_006879 [Bipolaris sorokiniana]|uniref:Uncharacterized protein n=1 Tax=Cochliobolus sativus TaxID=45130 RepID=A0A8H5ZR72_COCSA|nr:hypothetical protein GGP41_006879 [Bipolaris sorokiniana]